MYEALEKRPSASKGPEKGTNQNAIPWNVMTTAINMKGPELSQDNCLGRQTMAQGMHFDEKVEIVKLREGRM